MSNPNFQSFFATMSGETGMSAEAKTCVFWDVDDCPIPEDLHHNSIYWNIKSVLANEGCGDNVEFKVYGRDEKLADAYLLDAGTTFVPKVAIHVREMLIHICEWAMVNPRGSNLLVISKITREEEMLVTPEEDEEETFVIPEVNKLVSSVGFLAERGYTVLLAPPELPDKLVLHFTPRSVWNWTTLSHGGVPSAYPLELQPQLFKPNFQNLLETDSLAKTWVFWDLREWPTLGVELYEFIPNIESALVSRGFPGNMSFNFFFDNESIPYDDVNRYKQDRMAFSPISQGGLISRLEWILLHIYFWAIDNPVSIAEGEDHRLMLVSDKFPKEPEFVSGLGALITKGYKVLLVNDVEVPSITTLHTDWVWRSLFHGRYTRLCHHCGQAPKHHCGQAPEPKSQISNFQMFEETAEPSTDAKTVAKTGIFWDLDDFRIPDCLNPFDVRDNIESALKKKGFLVDWAVFFIYYTERLRWSDDLLRRYEDHGYFILKDGEDKISRAGWMLLDMHLWFLDNAVPNSELEYNMMIVSTHITEEPEFIPVLKTLTSKCHKVLLVQPQKTKSHKGQPENLAQPMEAESFGTESADWLWQNLVGGGSPLDGEIPVVGGSPLGEEEPSNNEACPHCGKYIERRKVKVADAWGSD